MSTFEDNLCNVLWIWIKPSRPTWGLRDWEEEKDMIWLQLWIGGWNQIVDTHPPLVPGGGIMGEKLVTKDKNRDGLPERWLKDWNCWGNLGRGTWPIQSGARVRPLRGLRERKARSGSGVWGGYWWVVGTGTGIFKAIRTHRVKPLYHCQNKLLSIINLILKNWLVSRSQRRHGIWNVNPVVGTGTGSSNQYASTGSNHRIFFEKHSYWAHDE